MAETLPPVAGVLLGKTSLNSLYGLMGEPPQPVSQFGGADSAGILGLRRRRMDKIVVFLRFNASCRPPGGLAPRGGF
jgi:hypothetical protein